MEGDGGQVPLVLGLMRDAYLQGVAVQLLSYELVGFGDGVPSLRHVTSERPLGSLASGP